MEDIIDEENNIIHKSQKGSTLKFSKINNEYYILMASHESIYYCINNCGSSIRCYCKDKDWSQGLWDGKLYYSSKYEETYNMFCFLKDNFEILCNLDRKKIAKWIKKNIDIFFNKYYEEKLILIKIYTLYLFHIGFFKKSLYTIIKDEFIKENNDLLNIIIHSENNYDNPEYTLCKKTIKIGDVKLFKDIKYVYGENNVKSSFEICIEHFENRFVMYNFILDNKKFLLNNINPKTIICWTDINIDLIKECRNKLSNYFSINENISYTVIEYVNKINLDLFYEKYNINENIKDLLKKYNIENIYSDMQNILYYFDNIIEELNLIEHNLQY